MLVTNAQNALICRRPRAAAGGELSSYGVAYETLLGTLLARPEFRGPG